MPFALSLLGPRTPSSQRLHSPTEDYDDNSSSSSSTESNETVRSSRGLTTAPAARPRISLQYASPTQPTSSPAATVLGPPAFLLPSANSTPLPSRSSSPLPIHYASPGASSSSYTSDADSEPTSPLLGITRARSTSWWNDDSRRWWLMGSRAEDSRRRRRRLRRETRYGVRTLKRQLRRLIRHPLFPKQPTSIILTLLIFTVIAILITLLLMHILNPDKASLPWRTYCSIPSTSTTPPSLSLSPTDDPLTVRVPVGFDPASPNEPLMSNPFPPLHLDDIPPAGLFLGVFTTDSAVERRMLIRSTWASQERSRAGACDGDGGNSTSRTIVRFVLGKPRSGWERRIQLESETYNDIVQLPISENMNSGKTHAFFTWAAENAWVPAPSQPHHPFSYSNHTIATPPIAPHDPQPRDESAAARGWVRPDYVAKADDDSFVMLAELEARLRVELDDAMKAAAVQRTAQQRVWDLATKFMYHGSHPHAHLSSDTDSHLASRALSQTQDQAEARVWPEPHFSEYSNPADASLGGQSLRTDPLIYWGYRVKNRFMAGELYALSWSLVSWVSTEPSIKTMTRGAEDKQTAKWMRLHPRASEIRWASERCWIYDHPRAATVYSHGFLFPSEATRVRRSILSLLKPIKNLVSSFGPPSGSPPSSIVEPPLLASAIGNGSNDTVTYALPSPLLPTTPSYSYSSVSQFGTHYTFPLATLTPQQSIEALVEGSPMSGLFEGGPETAAQAWERREGRRKRYEGKRVGGTVVVHFIKRNEWFMETALALLGGEEVIAGEDSWTLKGDEVRAGDVEEAPGEGMTKKWAGHQAISRRRR